MKTSRNPLLVKQVFLRRSRAAASSLWALLFFMIHASVHASVTGKNGAVVTANPLATEVGIRVLKEGGNAYDAAVAVQFALAVVYPQAGNIAGGGFLVYCDGKTGEVGALDFREKAPFHAHRDMYLNDQGQVVPGLSRDGALAVGVPGSVAGMVAMHERLGSLPWRLLLQPAIDLARGGFTLSAYEAQVIQESREDLRRINADAVLPFVHNTDFRAGDRMLQPALADTLERIQQEGNDGFYRGPVAAAMVETIQQNGGCMSLEDLSRYRAIWRHPVSGHYRGYTVYSMSPPSSGGIALMQLLIGSEAYDMSQYAPNSANEAHLMTELMRRVYADRATWLGDSDFVKVPIRQLLDADYIRQRNATINLEKATPSIEVKQGEVERIESYETTHFSIVDRWGNAAAITTTLNSRFGSKLYVPDAGCFLNNEMDDFSAKPGVANQFGLVGSEANAIEGGKRMLSSMSPTLVMKEGKLRFVLGTPGGSTIITNVYQTLINVMAHGMSIQEAVDDRKIHAQWLPDLISFETGALTPEAQADLIARGHQLKEISQIGRLEAIHIHENGDLEGAADETRPGDAAAAVF